MPRIDAEPNWRPWWALSLSGSIGSSLDYARLRWLSLAPLAPAPRPLLYWGPLMDLQINSSPDNIVDLPAPVASSSAPSTPPPAEAPAPAPPPPAEPPAPPPAAVTVLEGQRTERELELAAELEREKAARRKAETDCAWSQDENRRLKTVAGPRPPAPAAARAKKSGWTLLHESEEEN